MYLPSGSAVGTAISGRDGVRSTRRPFALRVHTGRSSERRSSRWSDVDVKMLKHFPLPNQGKQINSNTHAHTGPSAPTLSLICLVHMYIESVCPFCPFCPSASSSVMYALIERVRTCTWCVDYGGTEQRRKTKNGLNLGSGTVLLWTGGHRRRRSIHPSLHVPPSTMLPEHTVPLSPYIHDPRQTINFCRGERNLCR